MPPPPSTTSTATDLKIAPVEQATPVWCWIAVGEMLFRHLGVPAVNDHYQCGVVGAISIATNRDVCARDCRKCNVPGGDATTVMGMLAGYPRRAALLTGQKVPRIFVSHTATLGRNELRRELDAGNPVLAGINPWAKPGAGVGTFAASAHLALIVGYGDLDGQLFVRINDPYPFVREKAGDPYVMNGGKLLQPGQYGISYDAFVSGLGWAESFLVRSDGVHSASSKACLASLPLAPPTRCAAPAAAVGSACACGGVAGVVVDGG